MVVLDTNATFLPFRERFPLEAEVGRLVPGAELVVPAAVVAELDRLSERDAPFARAALAFVRRLRTVASDGRGDDAVLDAARRLRAPVVTADRTLGERLRAEGLEVLAPRDRSRLDARSGGGRPRTAARRKRPARPKG